jgi:AcrR family transcriptional regulator
MMHHMAGPEPSLRERKKAQTRQLISDVATGLFLAHGFERVTVAEVARAANVSVNTVFNYFPTKEDLFFDREATVEDLFGSVVRGRRPGESAVGALRRWLLDGLAAGDWTAGLPEGSAEFYRVIDASPSLAAREREMGERARAALAATLAAETDAAPDDPMPILVAGLVTGGRAAVFSEARRRLLAGASFEEVKSWFGGATDRCFVLIEQAVPGYCVRPPGGGSSR